MATHLFYIKFNRILNSALKKNYNECILGVCCFFVVFINLWRCYKLNHYTFYCNFTILWYFAHATFIVNMKNSNYTYNYIWTNYYRRWILASNMFSHSHSSNSETLKLTLCWFSCVLNSWTYNFFGHDLKAPKVFLSDLEGGVCPHVHSGHKCSDPHV